MDILQIIVLALVQGLTEFLPISSSAHLILVPIVTDWEDQGLAFDVAVHVGTLLAVMLYFREEVRRLLLAWVASIVNRQMSADARLAWLVVLGTVPVGLAGLLDRAEEQALQVVTDLDRSKSGEGDFDEDRRRQIGPGQLDPPLLRRHRRPDHHRRRRRARYPAR